MTLLTTPRETTTAVPQDLGGWLSATGVFSPGPMETRYTQAFVLCRTVWGNEEAAAHLLTRGWVYVFPNGMVGAPSGGLTPTEALTRAQVDRLSVLAENSTQAYAVRIALSLETMGRTEEKGAR